MVKLGSENSLSKRTFFWVNYGKKCLLKKTLSQKKKYRKKIRKKNFIKKIVVNNLWSIDFGQKKFLVKENQKNFGQIILVTK